VSKLIEMFSDAQGNLSSMRAFNGVIILGAFIDWMGSRFIEHAQWEPGMTVAGIIIGALTAQTVKRKFEK